MLTASTVRYLCQESRLVPFFVLLVDCQFRNPNGFPFLLPQGAAELGGLQPRDFAAGLNERKEMCYIREEGLGRGEAMSSEMLRPYPRLPV